MQLLTQHGLRVSVKNYLICRRENQFSCGLLLPVSLDLPIVRQRLCNFFFLILFLRSTIGRRYFNVYSVILYSFETHRVYTLSLTDTRASLQSRYTFFLSFKYVKSATSCSYFSPPRELASVHRLLLTGYVCYSFEVEAFLSIQGRKEGCLFKPIQTTFSCHNTSTNIMIFIIIILVFLL